MIVEDSGGRMSRWLGELKVTVLTSLCTIAVGENLFS
jgi:hypothetical protein